MRPKDLAKRHITPRNLALSLAIKGLALLPGHEPNRPEVQTCLIEQHQESFKVGVDDILKE